MKKTITARHNANQQVLFFLNNNQSKFAHIPAMVKMLSNLDTLIEETNSLITKVGSIPGKTAGNKNLARAELTAIVLKISNIIRVYAFISQNKNLNNFVGNIHNTFLIKMRDQEFLDFSKNLLVIITPLATDLADFGLSEKMITELDTETKAYKKVLTEPRQLINERKTTNELIEDNIDKIHSLLNNQIDPMMELFVDDREFYLAYKSARMIVDPASRKKTEESERPEEQSEE